MSIARHHAEWLSLVEVSGPFLSMPVLLRVFPQGLDASDPDLNSILSSAYEEWADNQAGNNPDESIHTQWLRFVLSNVLGMDRIKEPGQMGLLTGAALPPSVRIEFKEHNNEILFPDYALVAPGADRPALLIQQYPARQDLNASTPNPRWNDSPALRMMQLLRATEVRLGLITNGKHWMLIDAPRNETTAFISWYADLWTEEPLTLRAFRNLLHLRRFYGVAPDDTLQAMLIESASKQHEVTDQLGYQVRRAVEVLIHALDHLDKESGRQLLAAVKETELYEAALTVMMRLVFLLSAEERKLLPLGEALYNQNYAASTLQAQLRKQADHDDEIVLEQHHDAWSRLLALFRIVYGGVEYPDLRLPAYAGHLFDPDRFPFLEGRAPKTSWREVEAEPLLINNRTVLHLLEALQLLQVEVPGGGAWETRRLSFRALDIEQIGHVYEGLLDHTARRASEPVLSLSISGKRKEGIEVTLAALEQWATKGEAQLLTFLEKKTGLSAGTIQKARALTPNVMQLEKLKRACDDDHILLQRVLPFAGLLRSDNLDTPMVIPRNSVYMAAGTDRRTSGTHYTPRSLTEPIVQHTLDPLVYIGPAEGLPVEQWQLRSVPEILDLKVCDFAMGSGAFLVQTCRYLSQKLMLAWQEVEWRRPNQPITTEGQPATDNPQEIILPLDSEEREAIARRLVAERCLYGVDKNPMAVEMAKLSLWLITLDKRRPFTFLDHALISGDSLLGVNVKQLTMWSMDPNLSETQIRQNIWVQEPLRIALNTARKLRRELRMLSGDTIQHVETKTRLLKESNDAMEQVKLGADLLIVTTLQGLAKHKHDHNEQNTSAEQGNSIEAQQPDNEIPHIEDFAILLNSFEDARRQNWPPEMRQANQNNFVHMRQRVDQLLGERNPFHWPLIFPEAFIEHQGEPGFAALVSNPPFQGGSKITGALGTDYRDYLVTYLAYGQRGSADLCAYFFLRASDLVRQEGQCGLLATNSIAQGDTREVGLDQILTTDWTIPRAVPSRKWPGTAGLEVAHIWLRNGNWQGGYILDEMLVEGISSYLDTLGKILGIPHVLIANANKSFIGSYVLGMGFVLEPDDAQALIDNDPRNRDVLFPYLNGEDLNSRPDQSPSRWVINFHDWSLEQAKTYTDCIKILDEKVRPERGNSSEKILREKWWLYKRSTPTLYAAISQMNRVLVIARVSTHHFLVLAGKNQVFSDRLVVISSQNLSDFVVLSSSLHEIWAHRPGTTTHETRNTYFPETAFETFPFSLNMNGLNNIGERYDSHRQSIMLTRQEGLTKTYNRFHNPGETSADIAHMRELHREMDEAVAAAYGWQDLPLKHGFHQTRQGLRYTISEDARREVLDRLLKLNHERYAEEVAQGLHAKATKNGSKKASRQKNSQSKPAPVQADDGLMWPTLEGFE